MSDEQKLDWEANVQDGSVKVRTSKSWERKKTLGAKKWEGEVDLKAWFSRLLRRGKEKT